MGREGRNNFVSKRIGASRLNCHGVAACIVAAMIAIDAIWLTPTEHSVPVANLSMPFEGAVFLGCLAAGFKGATYVPRYHAATKALRFLKLANIVTWMLWLGLYMLSGSILSYLCATTNAPLISATLRGFDTALGFDWLGIYLWVQAHPAIKNVLRIAYDSGTWQLYLVPIAVGLCGRRKDISDFMLLFMLSGAFVMVFSAVFPAENAFVYFGIIDPGTASTVSGFKILRDGTLRVFDISRMQGIVSIPSSHTMLAVFFIYTLRNVRPLFAIALPLNPVLIASTPPQGGHYLADVVCGLLGSALAIWMLRYVTARYGSRHAATAPLVSALPELTPLSRTTWRK